MSGNCTYYQWGRKDPFVGYGDSERTSSYDITQEKLWYNFEGAMKQGVYLSDNDWDDGSFDYELYIESYPWAEGELEEWDFTLPANEEYKEAVSHPIREPNVFNRAYSVSYRNLWNAEYVVPLNQIGSDHAVTKTVYDPSPVGYHVPASNAFTGLTSTGGYYPYGNNVSYGTFVGNGLSFVKPGSDEIFFPLSSVRRHGSAMVTNFMSEGLRWTADRSRANSQNIFYFNLTAAGLNPCLNSGDHRSNAAMVVRPVAD